MLIFPYDKYNDVQYLGIVNKCFCLGIRKE